MCDNKVKLVVGQAMQTRLKLPGKGRLGTGGSGWKASVEMLFGLCISYYINLYQYLLIFCAARPRIAIQSYNHPR